MSPLPRGDRLNAVEVQVGRLRQVVDEHQAHKVAGMDVQHRSRVHTIVSGTIEFEVADLNLSLRRQQCR